MSEPVNAATLIERFERRLSEPERAGVAAARGWAEARSARLYCVGGTLRDLLLDRPHLDVDLALDGDAAALGADLGAQFSAPVTTHPHFGTAVVGGESWSIDIARTRSERYACPAALPDVSPAPIEQDLARRDFTIHALALRLTGKDAGGLIDPHGGIADLHSQLLRVLHHESFRDDPTRILRLSRYAARLGFAIEEETAVLAQRDATFLAATSPARITHELERNCKEPFPERSFVQLRDLHALTAFYPRFRVSDTIAEVFVRLRRDGGPTPAIAEYLAALAAGWDRRAIQGLGHRLELRSDTVAALHDLTAATATLRALASSSRDPSLVVKELSRYQLAAVRGGAAALGGAAARLLRRYLTEWANVRPFLRGHDVLALGVPAGPDVGRILDRLRAGKLRNELHTPEEERAQVNAWLRDNLRHDGGESERG